MNLVYIYEDFSGFDIELYNSKLDEDQLYDPICDENRKLLLVTDNIDELIGLFPVYGITSTTNRYVELIEYFKEIRDGKINSSEID